MSKKKTHSEYVAEVKLITSDIEIIGLYIDSNTKIKHRCRVCNHEWDAKPSGILRGQGCPECARYKRAKSNTKSHEQYVAELAIINPSIEVIGRYVHANAKIECKCKICGHKWFVRAADILIGHGCPMCSYKFKTRTQDQYIADLAKVNPSIVVIGKYINCYTKIRHLCLICGHEWDAKPNSLLHGNHCPRCSTRRKSHEQYIAELAIKNPNIEVIEEYINANTNILHRCIICGHTWMLRPNHALHGLGCPSCQETSGEQQVKQWLIENGIEYEYQMRFADCKNMRMLPFDFYLPKYNCCIEYDGAQHFKEVYHWGGQEYLLQRQNNDKIKNDYCKNNNIYLVRIRYDENVYRILDDALKSMLLSEVS